jgi:hypothetical protein
MGMGIGIELSIQDQIAARSFEVYSFQVPLNNTDELQGKKGIQHNPDLSTR